MKAASSQNLALLPKLGVLDRLRQSDNKNEFQGVLYITEAELYIELSRYDLSYLGNNFASISMLLKNSIRCNKMQIMSVYKNK
jgi:hypothetical protein